MIEIFKKSCAVMSYGSKFIEKVFLMALDSAKPRIVAIPKSEIALAIVVIS